jgi:outer membrane protein TolC
MKPIAVALLFAGCSLVSAAEAPLTLKDAVRLAAQHSKPAQLAQLKAAEARLDAISARQLAYPRLTAFGLGAYYFRPIDLKIREGSLTNTLDALSTQLGLGPLSSQVGPFPSDDLTLVRGSHEQYFGGLTLLQPLTQQWRIASGVSAAKAGQTAAERERDRALAEIQLAVEQLYAGILLEDKRREQLEAKITFEERRLRDAENAKSAGELLDAPVLGSRATVVQARAERLKSEQHRNELALQLADFIGRAGQTELTLTSDLPDRPTRPLDYWLQQTEKNPDRQVATAIIEKARAGVRASRQARIPEVSAFATGFAQDGLPLAPSTGGTVGLALTWDIFDGGRRRTETARSVNQQRMAELNVERLTDEAARLIRTAYQDFVYAEQQIALADEAASYRRRAAELAHQSAQTGLELERTALEADSELRKAETDLLGARLQRHVALLKLYFLAGKLAGGIAD